MMDLRRYRLSQTRRDLFSTVQIHPSQLIQPFFISKDAKERTPISSITGLFYETKATIFKSIESLMEKNIKSFLFFPHIISHNKSKSLNFDFQSERIYEIKKRFKHDIVLFTDVCLCPYTETGYCGFTKHDELGEEYLDNDSTVKELVRASLSYAQAGVDGLAPSDMFDNRIRAIRQALDANSYDSTMIMSYSSKMQSSLYGAFRNTLDSHPKNGLDRKSHQIASNNLNDIMLSSLRDKKEGADIIMVKPATFNLDILARLKMNPETTHTPLAAYHVASEIESLRFLESQGMGNFLDLYHEAMISIKRAGADMIITYGCSELEFSK